MQNRKMEFNPGNPVIKLCVQGMGMEDKGEPDAASRLFLQAWNESANDFEKFTAAYYVARSQKDIHDKLKWLETALQFASKINDDSVKAAFPSLYSNIAKCYEDLGDLANAKRITNEQFRSRTNRLTAVLFITERKQICRLAIC